MKIGLLKVEDRRPGKIMLLHNINYNILFYHPYYSGVYQDGAKMRALQRDKLFWGGWKKTKK